MRGVLLIGTAIAFVAVVVGATFEGLAILGVLALLDRAERRA